MVLSVNLLETFRELFHEGQGTREFLGLVVPGSESFGIFVFCFFGAMDPLLTNWGSYGCPFRIMLSKCI